MPALATQNPGVSAIATFESLLNKLLDEAEQLKPYSTIDSESSALEAPLTKSDFQNLSQRVDSSLSSIAGVAGEEDSEDGKTQVKSRRLAIIESAARDIFGSFVVRPRHALKARHLAKDYFLTSIDRPPRRSTPPNLAGYGTYLTYYQSFPITANVIRRCYFGSLRSSSTAKP
jgi:hypothetical protein